MEAHFGIGGQFLAGLAQTGKVSDTALQRIAESNDGLNAAAEFLSSLAESIREQSVERMEGYSQGVEILKLPPGITEKLRAAGIETIAALVADWPGPVRVHADLDFGEMGKLSEVLHDRGFVSDRPKPASIERQKPQELNNPDS